MTIMKLNSINSNFNTKQLHKNINNLLKKEIKLIKLIINYSKQKQCYKKI